MAGRRFPWDLRPVPWSDLPEFTRGTLEGLPLLSWGIGPQEKLATRRQLRAMGLRPGGQDPVALLYFRCRKACTQVVAELFLIEKAQPVRPMTPARRAALAKAMAARRTCRQCGETGYAELPRAHRTCEPCRYTLGQLDPTDYLHDYLTGTPTLAAGEHAEQVPERIARVIPLHRPARPARPGSAKGVA
ncbi:RRQRL motif-containing zinc-binding protein [Amycolatopsis cihanbeyliensis]|uniref:Uncharacterized protein n=1 Tax=Amycolatopsis cihanbeyliensis TaxID=1128664 RepID=A0A542DJJ5_AMYCI|nr:RRQRL motif-containing zinc-binding protein [Amycolatopsis cihanbeyliensis]TQJ03263.1 hypothetical protein FB471_3018 [Amycolatopsis cihanbeyliensis]